MKLKELLSEKKSAILNRWFDMIVETYPDETAKFLRSQKNRFSNPVGSTIYQGIENVFDEILHQDMNSAKVSTFLDTIVRIRAVQDFNPSQALSFIFHLKTAIREELKKDIQDNQFANDLVIINSRIDALALLSFDIYMKCREKLYDIKANEVKNRTFRLLQQANLIVDSESNSDEAPNPVPDNST